VFFNVFYSWSQRFLHLCRFLLKPGSDDSFGVENTFTLSSALVDLNSQHVFGHWIVQHACTTIVCQVEAETEYIALQTVKKSSFSNDTSVIIEGLKLKFSLSFDVLQIRYYNCSVVRLVLLKM